MINLIGFIYLQACKIPLISQVSQVDVVNVYSLHQSGNVTVSLEYKWRNSCCTHHAVRGLTGPHEQSSLSKPQCAQFVLCVVSVMCLHDLVYAWFALHMDLYCLQGKFFGICSPIFFFLFLLLFFSLNKTFTCSPFPVENLQKASSFQVLLWYSWKTWHICISQ